MKQQRIEIVTGEKRIPEIVPVVQRDSGRELHCLITDLKIPAGAVARIYARKPSGKEIYNDCTVLGNTVVVKLTTQMLAETGKVTCQVEISEESSKVSSFAFLLSVEERIDSGSAIESTDEFTALENALWEVEEAAENANAAAGEANKIADTVQQKLDNGEFVGPQGPIGPIGPQGPQGERGAEGAAVITQLAPGMFALSVNSDGHLILAHNDNEPAPPLKITEDGRLIYTIL